MADRPLLIFIHFTELGHNGVLPAPLCVPGEYLSDDLCFFLAYDQLPIYKTIAVWHRRGNKGPIFHFHAAGCGHTLGCGQRFTLRKCTLDIQDHLRVHIFRVDVVVFKIHAHPALSQHPHTFDTLQRISRKTLNALDKDSVDLSVLAVLQHSLKLIALIDAGSRNPFIRVYIHEGHLVVTSDIVAVIPHLRHKGIELIVGIRTDPTICRHSDFLDRVKPHRGLNDLDFSYSVIHTATSLLVYYYFTDFRKTRKDAIFMRSR